MLIKNYLIELQKQKAKKKLQYEVVCEVTHHGPWLQKPAVFIELGSSEKQWKDEAAARAIVETILNATNLQAKIKACVGVGGQHYQNEFTKLMLNSDYAFSHMCPKYNLHNLNAEMLGKAIDATVEEVEEIIVDYKGLGTEKERLMGILEASSLPVKRVQSLLG
jgi:D-aminoacyl-tRNA deacylase